LENRRGDRAGPAGTGNNKEQIVSTLKNYDIVFQKISAAIGPDHILRRDQPGGRQNALDIKRHQRKLETILR